MIEDEMQRRRRERNTCIYAFPSFMKTSTSRLYLSLLVFSSCCLADPREPALLFAAFSGRVHISRSRHVSMLYP